MIEMKIFFRFFFFTFCFFPCYSYSNDLVGSSWVIDVQQVKLGIFTKEISKITKKNFIVSSDIYDVPVNVSIKRGVSSDELMEYYVDMVNSLGYHIIIDGDLYKVTKLSNAFSVYKLQYADAENLANVINSVYPSSVSADISSNSIIYKLDSSLNLFSLISSLDSKKNQVLINAVILEVSSDDVNQLGVQWALGSNNSYGSVNLSSNNSLSSLISGNKSLSVLGGLLGFGSSSNDNFYGVVLNAVSKVNSVNLLSSPSVLVVDNSSANILVGQNVPVVIGTQLDKNNDPVHTISRLDVGISLKVIPSILSDGNIRLKVYQEVSNVVDSSYPNGIITNKSVIDTNIVTNDGEVIVLGGLVRDSSVVDNQEVPKLSKIPVLGGLFRNKNEISKKSNLVIFLQASIVSNALPKPVVHDYSINSVVGLGLDEHGNIYRYLID